MKVESESLRVDDRLAAEIFQIVAEGLSNIRRHTQSDRATRGSVQDHGALILTIENDNPDQRPVASFTPASISLRAHRLGGTAVD